MNSNPLYILTDDEKREIEHLVERRLNENDPNSSLCQRIDEKVHGMELHMKAYFHELWNKHQN